MRRAIIVGSGGQDGSLLYGLLLQKGYEVIGLGRSSITSSTGTWDRAAGVDISNLSAVSDIVWRAQPDEIYFLAAHHHSSQDDSGDEESLFRKSTEVNLAAPVVFLEAMRRDAPHARLFYAASSHIFGSPPEQPQDEKTPINPDTVYGITKAAGLFTCRRYRNAHGLYASVGILYNHESPLRSARFVSRKIAIGAAEIKRGRSSRLVLGDPDASVDWGYAPDYVEGMHRMLQLDAPDDFILATGKLHTVRDFASAAFRHVGLDYERYVETDAAVNRRRMAGLVGDPAKFRAASNWVPSVDFVEMVCRLVQHELKVIDGK